MRRETDRHIGDCTPHAYICEIRFETHLPQSQLRLPANDAGRFPSAMNDVWWGCAGRVGVAVRVGQCEADWQRSLSQSKWQWQRLRQRCLAAVIGHPRQPCSLSPSLFSFPTLFTLLPHSLSLTISASLLLLLLLVCQFAWHLKGLPGVDLPSLDLAWRCFVGGNLNSIANCSRTRQMQLPTHSQSLSACLSAWLCVCS